MARFRAERERADHEPGDGEVQVNRFVYVDESVAAARSFFREPFLEFMRTRANLPEPTARAEVARYCSWPTQASAYLTGCLEILRIRDRFQKERSGSLRAFHDRMGLSGALPIALAEEVALNHP